MSGSTMVEIHGRKNASNVIPVMWAVGELGLSHVRHDIGGSFGGLNTVEYLALNPNGRIPVIKDNDCVVYESHAVVRYLCMRYGAGSLWPDDWQTRARADQWMEWHKTIAYRDYIDLFWAVVRTEPSLRDGERIASLAKSLGATLTIVDAHLERQAYLVGDTFTMGDIPLGTAMYRYFNLDVERPDLPNVEAWYRRLCARSAYRDHVMQPVVSNPAQWYAQELGATQVK